MGWELIAKGSAPTVDYGPTAYSCRVLLLDFFPGRSLKVQQYEACRFETCVRVCSLQLEEQMSANQAQGEEHAAMIQALEGAKSGREGELASRCTDLEAKLAKLDQVSQLAMYTCEKKSKDTVVWQISNISGCLAGLQSGWLASLSKNIG